MIVLLSHGRSDMQRDPSKVYVCIDQRVILRGSKQASCGRLLIRMFSALFTRPQVIVSRDEIIDACWGDREDGGPDDACGNLRRNLHKLRVAIMPLGVTIRTHGLRGFSAEIGEIAP